MRYSIYLSRTPWTEQDDDFLRNYYVQLSQRQMAVRLSRTKGEVQSRLEHLDLKLTEEQKALKKQAAAYKMREAICTEIFWTDQLNEFLSKHYAETLNSILANSLDVSVVAIQKQAGKLGLKKSDEYLNRLRKKIIPRLRYSHRTKKEVSDEK